MNTARTSSRRKICSKVLRTEVVPAPEEPVTEMMGCRADMLLYFALRLRPHQSALAEERRAAGIGLAARIIGGHARDLFGGAADQGRALVDPGGHQVEDA